jgi:hypothetical protein
MHSVTGPDSLAAFPCHVSRHHSSRFFSLIMTDSMATEKHGKNDYPLEIFPCPSVAMNKKMLALSSICQLPLSSGWTLVCRTAYTRNTDKTLTIQMARPGAALSNQGVGIRNFASLTPHASRLTPHA